MSKIKKVGKVKKTVIKKPAKEKKEKVSTTVTSSSVATPNSVTEPIFPFYNGARVIEIMNETEPGHKLCKMSDGTTVHVPNELFV